MKQTLVRVSAQLQLHLVVPGRGRPEWHCPAVAQIAVLQCNQLELTDGKVAEARQFFAASVLVQTDRVPRLSTLSMRTQLH